VEGRPRQYYKYCRYLGNAGGIGATQFGYKLFLKKQNASFFGYWNTELSETIITPDIFLILLWGIGIILFVVFKQNINRY